MIAACIDKFRPDATDMWSTDGLCILVRKMMLCLYSFMDHGFRRLLSAGMAGTKHTASVAPLARDAKKVAAKMPEVELRDRAANLHSAIRISHRERKGGKKRETE